MRLFTQCATPRQRFSAVVGTAVLITVLASGQTFQASLRGRVLDPSGTAVPGTKITITDEATQAARASVTNDQGEYVFTALTPAAYTLVAEAPGFKRVQHQGFLSAPSTMKTIQDVSCRRSAS